MAVLKYRVKNEASLKGKPRVYFTCHPEDFEKHFDKVCNDIFKFQDCVIYYTEDMNAPIADEDRALDIGSNNLVVIPVTFKLLTTPNRAVDEDLVYALKEHIPILPIMMESGIDELYAQPDRFGELQYLNPYSSDTTEIAYEDKLERFLSSVLISSDLANRVRAAFDAYIFLSYRKKDRNYANQLMRLIHSHPECRDIAIWYDEFLTPGESFKENISKILNDSKLFALLVTPNLLEEPDGQPNYVMAEEYPTALHSGIDILPAEMEQTDKDKLCEKYKGIPECVNPHNDQALRTRLMESIFKVVRTANDDDPAHNFLIGLAYLEGIDVEVDRERALSLITSSANNGLPEAMEKMYFMYQSGIGTSVNYEIAAIWAERLIEYYHKQLGENHPTTMKWLYNLAFICHESGNYQKALKLGKKVFSLHRKIFGETDIRTLGALSNLAAAYGGVGNYTKMLELNEEVYTLRAEILGKEHEDTITSLCNLAYSYGQVGNHEKELELQQEAYSLRCRILGEEDTRTLQSLNNLASIHGALGNRAKALELNQKAYSLFSKRLGEEHPYTLVSLGNLAFAYGRVGDIKKHVELYERKYQASRKVLGEKHPDTLLALNGLAVAYGEMGEKQRSKDLQEKVYAFRCEILGNLHPQSLRSLSNLAAAYAALNDWEKVLELNTKAYDLRRKVLGETHPDTLKTMFNLAFTYGKLGDWGQAYNLSSKEYSLRCKRFGDNHPETKESLKFLMITEKEAERERQCHDTNLCRFCGGQLTGIFKKKCKRCGKHQKQ